MPKSWLDMKPECPNARDAETGRHCGTCYHRKKYACCLCGAVHPEAHEVEAMLRRAILAHRSPAPGQERA